MPSLRRALRAPIVLTALTLGLGVALSLQAHAQVGRSTLTVDGQPLTLVYPSDEAVRPMTIGPFQLEVAPDAPATPGRHRLIVMSHGTAGSPAPDHALAATLARAGFVVAQLTHEGDNFRDTRLAGPESFKRRPLEAVRAIDALAADRTWSSRLDLSKVGVHGMSAGGVTALSLAGAQWNMLTLIRHCNDHIDEDSGFCLQGTQDPEGQAARRQRFESARGVPDDYLPAGLKELHGGRTPGATDHAAHSDPSPDPRPDPRIASVTLAVPVAAVFTRESLARIRVPVGIVAAREDRLLVSRWHSDYVVASCQSCSLLADLPGGHFDVLRPWPDSVAREVGARQVRGGEITQDLDPALLSEAHERIAKFHRQHLSSQR